MTVRASRSPAAAAVIAAALAWGAVVPLSVMPAPAAQAAVPCETRAPFSDNVGTSVEFVYAAEAPIGGVAVIQVPELCVPASATVAVLANDDAVAVDVAGDGTVAATVTLTAPTIDFEGIARVDLEITDGAETFVLELYGFFGVAPTAYGFERPAPVATAIGAPAHFPLSGTVPRAGATITAEVIRSTQPVTVSWVDSPSDGVLVTPPASFRGVIGVEVLITDGITSTRTTVYQWTGVDIPTGAVWAPNPPPAAIEQGGIGYFDLSGSFVPHLSECEIRVTSVPDVDIAVDPPSLGGVAFEPVGILVRDPDFVGLLTVSYDLSCRLPDLSRSSVEYELLLYVGVPIPELAATGSQGDVMPLGAGALALVVGGFALLRRRAARLSGSR